MGLLCWNPIWLSQLHTAASFTAETNFLVHEFMDFWNQKSEIPFTSLVNSYDAEKIVY